MTREISVGTTEASEPADAPSELAIGADAATSEPATAPGPAATEGGDGRDFARWLEHRHDLLVERWASAVGPRLEETDPAVVRLLRAFYDLQLRLLAGNFGPYRAQFEPLLRQVAELYGSLGALRSLAAGEIIEEVQHLREALIRLLFTDPPQVRGPAVLIREVLRLNRSVDEIVTFASVGHTDAMFFALFQGSGAPQALTPELQEEVEEQLDTLRTEADRLTGLLGRS